MTVLPKISVIYDRYKSSSPKKSASIEIRITYERKQKYISTGISVYPREWRRGEVVNRPDAQQLNQQLQMLIVDIRKVLIDMREEGSINIFLIPERVKQLRKKDISLYEFISQRMDIKVYGKSLDTKKRYERFFLSLKKYGKINSFDSLTEGNIIAFDKYLITQGMKHYSAWSNYHRFLNSFILDAMDEGLVPRNPYKWVCIDKGEERGINKYLTLEEFRRIQEAVLPTESLERVRDLFVFQTYTCLSYADLREFNPDAIVPVKGMKVYVGCREKTTKDFTIPLLPKALEILRQYNNILPVISNVKYNLYLKLVAQAAGIEKPVSTHWARHTGATLLLNAGVPMQIVSKICGHSSTKITEQVYAKLLDETVVEAVKKIMNPQNYNAQ